ncbi:MAG: histidinol-phosphate transaminase [bacterium]
MPSEPIQPVQESILPEPAPALAHVTRVREAGTETLPFIGLDRNERVSPFPGWFMEKLRAALTSGTLNRYPLRDRLHRLLAESLRLPEENILLTPGSDGALKYLFQAYVRPHDPIMMLDPSYAMYPVYARMHQAEAVLIPYRPDRFLDREAMLERLQPGVRLVLLANPNQPVGTLMDESLLRAVLERAREIRALVAVDEAYFPFSGFTVVPWIEAYPHLLVIRTFSKAAGLAGLRMGYAAGHPEVLGNLFKVHAANDINSFGLLCASLVLEHPGVIEEYVREVRAGGELLSEKARGLGLEPLPCAANFLLIRVTNRCSPERLIDQLRMRKYLVKGPFSAPCLQGCIRVTLGPPEMMASFAEVLAEAAAAAS